MKGQPRISPIYAMGPGDRVPSPEEVFSREWRLMRDLWVERGVISCRPDDLPSDLRDRVVAWASETFGEPRA